MDELEEFLDIKDDKPEFQFLMFCNRLMTAMLPGNTLEKRIREHIQDPTLIENLEQREFFQLWMQSSVQNAYKGQEIYFKMPIVEANTIAELNEEAIMLNAMQAIGKNYIRGGQVCETKKLELPKHLQCMFGKEIKVPKSRVNACLGITIF